MIWNRTAMMARLMDDEELANAIIVTFLDDIPRQIEALRHCVDSLDTTGAKRIAHSIKGASASVGGEALQAVALHVERAAKTGDVASAASRLPDLRDAFDSLRAALT
jgi:HPt (histidine-containing phosphotransfer) domain-containing protein